MTTHRPASEFGEWLDVAAVVDRSGWPFAVIEARIASGDLPSVRVNGERLVPALGLDSDDPDAHGGEGIGVVGG